MRYFYEGLNELNDGYCIQDGAEKSETYSSTHTLCSEKKHPLTFCSISLWKMFRFPQNFQAVFRRKPVFHQ